MTSFISQSVEITPLNSAIFLVVTLNPKQESEAVIKSLCGNLSALVRTVGSRDLEGKLSCVMAFGYGAWEKLFKIPKPKELHFFKEIQGKHLAPSTSGDILFHIRSMRMDLCFELITLIMSELGDVVSVVDEVHGFKYFDDRSMIGFVDGTENPVKEEAIGATIIGKEDIAFTGGSYVIVQKYIHDMKGWESLSTEQQEKIIGRRKLSNVELDDNTKPSCAHNALTTITEDGKQVKILRHNMPFGSPGKGEFGTYFIAYARSPRIIEQMLTNMFIGLPSGNYDRILDFSRAITGSLFFVPTVNFLEGFSDG